MVHVPVGKSRRNFLKGAACSGAILATEGCAAVQADPGGPEVSPLEDLMREHGLLNRVLLIYDEAARRLESDADLPAGSVAGAAGIIRRFIESYHEKLEEDHLFPRFIRAGKLVDLVEILRSQHEAGRRLTGEILDLAAAPPARSESRDRLAGLLRSFVRMYRPHAAREDTVLFPAFHDLVSAREYDALGDDFERRERELLGAEGFEGMVGRTSQLEKLLGLDDLARFTPR